MAAISVSRTVVVAIEGLPEAIKQAIKDERETTGRTVTAIAIEAGIDRTYLYRVASGAAPNVSEEMVQAIEKTLGVDFGVRAKLDDASLAAAGIG